LLFAVSFFFAFSESEGAEGMIVTIMSFPTKVLSYPFFWLRGVFRLENILFVPLSFVLDILLFAIIVERLIFIIRHSKRRKEVV
jgi:hypothetical protein